MRSWLRKIFYRISDVFDYAKHKEWHEVNYAIYLIWQEIQYPFYNFYKQSGRILSYIPVLWNDYDFDGHYLLRLMRHKLVRMEKCIRNGHHMRSEQDANEIKEAIIILDRMIADEYEDEGLATLDAKWGESQISTTPVLKDGKTIYYEMGVDYPNVKNEEDEKQHNKEFHALYTRAELKERLDFGTFFMILAKNLRKWWN